MSNAVTTCVIDPLNLSMGPSLDYSDPDLIPVDAQFGDEVAREVLDRGPPDKVVVEGENSLSLQWRRIEQGQVPIAKPQANSDLAPFNQPNPEAARVTPSKPRDVFEDLPAGAVVVPDGFSSRRAFELSGMMQRGYAAHDGRVVAISSGDRLQIHANGAVESNNAGLADMLATKRDWEVNPNQHRDYAHWPLAAQVTAGVLVLPAAILASPLLASGCVDLPETADAEVHDAGVEIDVPPKPKPPRKPPQQPVTLPKEEPADPENYADHAACPHLATNTDGKIVGAWVDEGHWIRLSSFANPPSSLVKQDQLIDADSIFFDYESGEPLLCGAKKALHINEQDEVLLCWLKLYKPSSCEKPCAGYYNIYCNKYNQVANSPPFEKITLVGDIKPGFSSTLLDDGRSVITWVDGGHVKFQVFAASGFADTGAIDVGEGDSPDIVHGTEDFVLAWKNNLSKYEPSVKVQKYSYAGESIWGSDVYKDHSVGEWWQGEKENPYLNISLARNSHGVLAVAHPKYKDILVTIISPDGSKLTSRQFDPIDEYHYKKLIEPSVFLNDRGNVLLTAQRSDGNLFHFSLANFFEPLSVPEIVFKDDNYSSPPYNDLQYAAVVSDQASVLTYADTIFSYSADPLSLKKADGFAPDSVFKEKSSVIYTTTVNFGDVAVGSNVERDINFTNSGLENLTLVPQALNLPFLSSAYQLTVSPFSTLNREVTFAPTEVGDHVAEFTWGTNDPERPTITIQLFGHGSPNQ